MKVLLLTRYSRKGASSRLRSYQYLPYLQTHGVEIVTNALLDDDYLHRLYSGERKRLLPLLRAYWERVQVLAQVRRYDLVWIEKEVFPWLPALAERLLRLFRIPYVVDYDDAIFHSYDMSPHPIVRLLLGRKIAAVMRIAALVTVGNGYLAEYATHAGARRVEVIPTVVDLDRYRPSRTAPSGGFVIGWVGTPKTAHYLSLVAPALRMLCADGEARLVAVGAGAIQLEGVDLDVLEWSEASEASTIASFDVGIMPLPDEPWERGKCGYKLIQYLACGKPVVASPVGVNLDIVVSGVTGYVAENPRDWVDALRRLATDPAKGIEMGRRGRQVVEERYALAVVAPRLLTLLLNVPTSDPTREQRNGSHWI